MNFHEEEYKIVESSKIVESFVEYVALKGITNNRLGIRLRPGDTVPAELVTNEDSLQMLLAKKAIEVKDTGG